MHIFGGFTAGLLSAVPVVGPTIGAMAGRSITDSLNIYWADNYNGFSAEQLKWMAGNAALAGVVAASMTAWDIKMQQKANYWINTGISVVADSFTSALGLFQWYPKPTK